MSLEQLQRYFYWEWFGPRWTNWAFGVRWSGALQFIALDLGPWCLCLEWSEKEMR